MSVSCSYVPNVCLHADEKQNIIKICCYNKQLLCCKFFILNNKQQLHFLFGWKNLACGLPSCIISIQIWQCRQTLIKQPLQTRLDSERHQHCRVISRVHYPGFNIIPGTLSCDRSCKPIILSVRLGM